MTFQPGKEKDFLAVFTEAKESIASFEGCRGVKLLNDIHSPNIFFTYSTWKSEAHLEKYRQSDLFKTTWEKTKVLFADKAEAWSMEEVQSSRFKV